MVVKGPFVTSDWFRVMGRGWVGVCDSRTFLDPVHVGDLVSFVGQEGVWRVAGIEISRTMMSPPTTSPWVGLRVYPQPEERP